MYKLIINKNPVAYRKTKIFSSFNILLDVRNIDFVTANGKFFL